MRKQIVYIALLALGAASTVHALEIIQISAMKKMADTRSSAPQDLPRGVSVSTERDVYYEFDIRSLSTQIPQDLRVQWVVFVEHIGGQLTPREKGSKDIQIDFGQTVEVRTEDIELRSRQWSTGRTGTVQERIAGYAVRVLSTAGDVLAEKYRPSSIASDVQWDGKTRKRPRREKKDRPSRAPSGWRNAKPL